MAATRKRRNKTRQRTRALSGGSGEVSHLAVAKIKPPEEVSYFFVPANCKVPQYLAKLALWTVSTNTHMCTMHNVKQHRQCVCSFIFRSRSKTVSQFIVLHRSLLSYPASDGKARISYCGFLKTSHTCGKHHSLTSENNATDTDEHTEVHVDSLQHTRTPLALFFWLY